jgi:serpin B
MQLGNADATAVVNGNTAFAIDLYHHLSSEPGNLLFSPYRISVALAMAYAGSRGKTETQIAPVLHFTLEQARLHPAFAALQAGLDAVQHVKLGIANSL